VEIPETEGDYVLRGGNYRDLQDGHPGESRAHRRIPNVSNPATTSLNPHS
jgi:hypothetical protein